MTERQPACTAEGIDPDDFFIEKDGKQYPDDNLLTHDEEQEIADAVIATVGDDDPDLFERIDDAIELAEEYRLKENLRRRRDAKAACYRCPMRLACLRMALDQRIEYGTFGGYYPEERRQILKLIDARERRESQQTDTPAEE